MVHSRLSGMSGETGCHGNRMPTVTIDSPLSHFEQLFGSRDGLKVTWAHAVNSRQKLEDALTGDVMMLEADVLLRGQGLPNQTDIPVMAHPPDTDSDITLQQWLGEVLNTTKGIKLDFKYTEALEPSMKVLKSFIGEFRQPVWINADIMLGPGSTLKDTPVAPSQFKNAVLEYFPECTLSIGWTTAVDRQGKCLSYSEEMVVEMTSFRNSCQDNHLYLFLAKIEMDKLMRILSHIQKY